MSARSLKLCISGVGFESSLSIFFVPFQAARYSFRWNWNYHGLRVNRGSVSRWSGLFHRFYRLFQRDLFLSKGIFANGKQFDMFGTSKIPLWSQSLSERRNLRGTWRNIFMLLSRGNGGNILPTWCYIDSYESCQFYREKLVNWSGDTGRHLE